MSSTSNLQIVTKGSKDFGWSSSQGVTYRRCWNNTFIDALAITYDICESFATGLYRCDIYVTMCLPLTLHYPSMIPLVIKSWLIMGQYNRDETSQKLRMRSSVTINCQVKQRLPKLSRLLKMVKIVKNCQHCWKLSNFTKFSKMVKIVKNCQNCLKM